ncbi:hypothetical protein NPIL_622911 [Nephila pilipes]|uniref:Uncharacterized protein n=1 Tax=Nephila pilipes TaxID=299642 RepID=A0A8X6MWT2_NEPPI|nr:hypothetical protein NPIL_622911 [Nephila pilipes]
MSSLITTISAVVFQVETSKGSSFINSSPIPPIAEISEESSSFALRSMFEKLSENKADAEPPCRPHLSSDKLLYSLTCDQMLTTVSPLTNAVFTTSHCCTHLLTPNNDWRMATVFNGTLQRSS